MVGGGSAEPCGCRDSETEPHPPTRIGKRPIYLDRTLQEFCLCAWVGGAWCTVTSYTKVMGSAMSGLPGHQNGPFGWEKCVFTMGQEADELGQKPFLRVPKH